MMVEKWSKSGRKVTERIDNFNIIAEKLLDISKTSANNVLNEMLKNKVIKLDGSGKNTYYILK